MSKIGKVFHMAKMSRAAAYAISHSLGCSAKKAGPYCTDLQYGPAFVFDGDEGYPHTKAYDSSAFSTTSIVFLPIKIFEIKI
jgi:hypothetical protein